MSINLLLKPTRDYILYIKQFYWNFILIFTLLYNITHYSFRPLTQLNIFTNPISHFLLYYCIFNWFWCTSKSQPVMSTEENTFSMKKRCKQIWIAKVMHGDSLPPSNRLALVLLNDQGFLLVFPSGMKYGQNILRYVSYQHVDKTDCKFEVTLID